MAANLELRVGNKYYHDSNVPQAFLDIGVDGIRAFAWAVGSEAAADQVRKGNEISGIFVDGYRSRAPSDMKRDIVWEFSVGNSQLSQAVREGLELCRMLSNAWGLNRTGGMAMSWGIYIDGKLSVPDELEKVQPGKQDVRITSNLAYARFLEVGHWTGNAKVIKRELKRGIRTLNKGKAFRSNLSITDEVARRLKKKYKSIAISDKWYDDGNNPFEFTKANPNKRWPAIVFNKRKRVL